MNVMQQDERSTRDKREIVVVRIAKAGVDALDKEAHRRHTTRSDVVRQAVRIGLQALQAEKVLEVKW